MKTANHATGLLGLRSRMLDSMLWLATGAGFLWLMAYTVPRQPGFALFLSVLGVGIFALALLRAEWALMLTIVVIPGITTITVTVFNRLQPSVQTGVFGPAAYVPVMAFVLGVWARAWVYRETTAPSRLRPWLLAFLALSVLSALVTCWRYADFWPVYNRPYLEQTVNTEGLLAAEAIRRVIWALMNYLSGPLLFLAVSHVVAGARARSGTAWCWRTWLTRRLLVPLWIGSAAPFLIGRYQTHDVWFGANRVYVWPWMNRINASFFDPNALGAYVILIVPWLLAVVCLAGAQRWRQLALGMLGVATGIATMPLMNRVLSSIVPAHSVYAYLIILGAWMAAGAVMWYAERGWWLAVPVGVACGMAVHMSVVLAGHAGSRTAVLGLIMTGIAAVLLASLQGVLRLRPLVSARMLRLIVSAMGLLYLAVGLWMFYDGAPRMRAWLQRHPKMHTLPLVKRLNQLPLGSFKQLYRQIILDRGPNARLALGMMRDAPLTGTGLGSFLTELPNWKQRERQVIYVPDTACNYYLQIGAEQGVMAIVVMLAVFGLWWNRWWQVWQQREARIYWLWIGTGMASMLISFIFGMHTLAAEIQALFWLYMAQVSVVEEDVPAAAPSRYRAVLWTVVIVIIIAQTAAQLSLAAQREAFGWDKREGFYPYESWPETGLHVRHTHLHANERIRCDGLTFVQLFACLHPDSSNTPVAVSFQLGGSATNVTVTDSKWREVALQVPFESVGGAVEFTIRVNRTWTGRDAGMNDDTRPLGVTLQTHTWLDTAGMFAAERWRDDGSTMAGQDYRWTGAHAQMLVAAPQPFLQVPVLVAHPDITSKPVTVVWCIHGGQTVTTTYAKLGWHDVVMCVNEPPAPGAKTCLTITVDRTWRPSDYGLDDERELGVAIGTPRAASDAGFYHTESWNNLFNYRWAGLSAHWTQRADSNGIIHVHALVAHPDAASQPVTLTLHGAMPMTVHITNATWHTIALTGTPLRVHALKGTVNRTWRPREHGAADERDLGFAIRF